MRPSPACRPTLSRSTDWVCIPSYLESSFILAARTFLSHFLALALAAYPTLRVAAFPFPPPSSPLATSPAAPPPGDELVVTKLASLNFLQLALRAAQAGVGESVEKVKVGGEWRTQRGQGTKVWQSLLARYEKQVPWLRAPEVKDVRFVSLSPSLICPRVLIFLAFHRRRPRSGRFTLGSSPRGRATRSWT